MDAPPVLNAAPETPEVQWVVPRWRRGLMLGVLLAYVAGIGVLAAISPAAQGPVLPEGRRDLLLVCVRELLLFGLVAGLAWALGRPRAKDLFLTRWEGWRTWGWSFLWSVAIRFFAMPFMVAYAAGLWAYRQLQGQGEISLDQIRPKFENLFSPAAFEDPVYLIVAMTVLSFGLGGLREELWRAGVLSAFHSLIPESWRNWRGRAAGILVAAIVFGGAHITQDVAGVVATFAIGLALGIIMVWRQSYWEAALAHGLFNASSMALVWGIQRWDPEALRTLMPH